VGRKRSHPRCIPLSPRIRSLTGSKIIYFDLVNVGSKTITAYSVGRFCTASDGVEHYLGSGGQDMIESSDPFPGSIAAKKPTDVWGWIEPQSRKRTGHNIFGCMEDTAVRARVNVEMVLFDDGSGEGNELWQKQMLETRKSRSQEMQRWVGRFGELRQAADLSIPARRLYQDLIASCRSSRCMKNTLPHARWQLCAGVQCGHRNVRPG
jgi:hypothetical protein